MSAMITGFYGVLVSLILRWLSSIVKQLQAIAAVVLTIMLDYFFFGQQIGSIKGIAIFFVLSAVFLYKLGSVKKVH